MNNFLTNKDTIIEWLDKYQIKNYTLVPDEHYGYVVDVKGNVDLFSKKLTRFPIKFNKVTGNFHCYDNKLVNLEGSPQEVGGTFSCTNNNQISSLEGGPQKVGGDFYCDNNQLTSLEFSPQEVGENFYCYNNKLISLEFCPEIVAGYFNCRNNPNLGELQNITNFSIIYQEHLKFKEKKDLAYKLEKELDNSSKSSRIKI